MEAECLLLDGQPTRPETLFGPCDFIRGELIPPGHVHLPTGGAVYFDTGVIGSSRR